MVKDIWIYLLVLLLVVLDTLTRKLVFLKCFVVNYTVSQGIRV